MAEIKKIQAEKGGSPAGLKPEELTNPFQTTSAPTAPVFDKPISKHHRSIFSRLLITFFLLSVAPIALSTILTTAVYQSSIREFLPESSVRHIEEVLLAQNTLILLLVMIMVIFAGSLISASLVRPLRRLLQLTHFVGEGKLQYRLRASVPDEIGELTAAFNTMVKKLREQQTRERVISQMKSEFISIAAHQLRTPLSAVKWTIKMLTDGDLGAITKEQREFLERGYQVNERMITLVGDLLNVARIEEGRFGYRFSLIDFADYISQFIQRYAPQVKAKNIKIVFEPDKLILPKINIDTSKMDLVLQNLLDNSVKYSSTGSTIKVTKSILPQFVEVTIKDSGIGIPRHQMHRVFTKFFRGDNVVRLQTEGSGLGLFIVRNIIKNHGGDIRVESEENRGTKMIFTLPLSKELIPPHEITFEEFIEGL